MTRVFSNNSGLGGKRSTISLYLTDFAMMRSEYTEIKRRVENNSNLLIYQSNIPI